MMISIKSITNTTATIFLLLEMSLQAIPPASLKYTSIREKARVSGKEAIIIPYAFSTESMGTTFGIGGGVKGFGQDQLWIGATAFTSSDGASSTMLGVLNLRMPGFDRLYISTIGSSGYYPRQRAYTEYPDGFIGTRAGSNDSDPNNYVEDSGHKNWFDVSLEYVLPMGSADDNAMITYHLRDGILVSKPSGGKKWNPLESGVTVLVAQQRNMYQSYETELGEIDGVIHTLDFGLLYDNTDFSLNPSFGSRQYIGSAHGIDWGDAEEDWRFFELEVSKYFSLSDSATARQRVVALNLWTGYSPTWHETVDQEGNVTIKEKPPFFEGANLGGFYRMRGYPQDRFHDKAVIYTTAEYRHTLRWNPLKNVSWLTFLQTDWLQIVASAEGGQVAPEYSASALFDDWKFCGGIGIRMMMSGGIYRLDFSASDEVVNGWVMVGHPF